MKWKKTKQPEFFIGKILYELILCFLNQVPHSESEKICLDNNYYAVKLLEEMSFWKVKKLFDNL